MCLCDCGKIKTINHILLYCLFCKALHLNYISCLLLEYSGTSDEVDISLFHLDLSYDIPLRQLMSVLLAMKTQQQIILDNSLDRRDSC